MNIDNFELGYNKDDFRTVVSLIKSLQNITNEYSSIKDITQIVSYDDIKKRFSHDFTKLCYYAGYIIGQEDFIKDSVKKNMLELIIDDIMVNDSTVSRTVAKEKAYKDERYNKKLTELGKFLGYTSRLKFLLKSYAQVLQAITQSVSTARMDYNNNKTE